MSMKDYVHFIPEAKENNDFPGRYEFVCIESIEELEKALEGADKTGYMAYDSETSSLDPTKGYIVGYSFCYENNRGYYVPVKTELVETKKPTLGKEALDELYEHMKKLKTVFV